MNKKVIMPIFSIITLIILISISKNMLSSMKAKSTEYEITESKNIDPQIIGALGAALFAKERFQRLTVPKTESTTAHFKNNVDEIMGRS